MEQQPQAEPQDWPIRPWLLGGLLALCGLAISIVTDSDTETPWRIAVAAFFFFGGIAAALTLEQARWKAAALFAVILALTMAGLAWHAMAAENHVADEEYAYAAAVFASLLAVPLFQAGFHRSWFRTPYRDTHYYVWTDAISGAGALAFTGLSWLVLALLDQLFELIDIDLIGELMREDWFGWTFSGAAFGASIGILRNQLKVLGALQSVVLVVLSLMAVPLAVALLLFLVPLAISGGQVLWDATRSPTPVLLACAAGAFILTNAIIRDDDDARSTNRIMLVAGAVLAFGVLPLSLFAAISLGARIGQHGLAPERIWAMIAILVAVAYGIAYWFGLARGRIAGWSAHLRRSNLHLAAVFCAVALFLALPVLDFGAISASNQLGRLESGDVSAEEFDYDALRWDFGDAGREALAELAKSDDAKVAELAQDALDRETRPWRGIVDGETASERLAKSDIRVTDPQVRADVEKLFRTEPWRCTGGCTVLDLGNIPGADTPHLAIVQGLSVQHLRYSDKGNLGEYYPLTRCLVPKVGTEENDKDTEPLLTVSRTDCEDIEEYEPNGTVEVRPFSGRQIYVDGQPVGQPFE